MPKKKLLLVIFLIISIALMTYQSNKGKFVPFGFLRNPFTWFSSLVNIVQDTVTSPFKRMFLREEENIQLKAELNKLLKEQQESQEILLENKRLKELLSLKDKKYGYVTTARVIARIPDHWSNTFILDKGLSQGVKKDMVAITPRGLVGKISEVSPSYSYLLLLTDINFSVATRLQESRGEGVVSGTGLQTCQLKYIPTEEEVKEGDIVITSGLDSIFPKGIPVGRVSKVDKKGTRLFQNIEVVQCEDTAKIEEVVIIKR